MKLTAKEVPYSSVVGSSIMLNNEEGHCVCILAIMVPNPQYNYHDVAKEVQTKIVEAFNEDQSSTAIHGDRASRR